MLASAIPKYSVRRVVYTREEFQIIDNKGNRLHYVDPEKNNGEIKDRVPQKETIRVIESPRLLTETEAGLLGLPFEGEKIAAIPSTTRDDF